MLLLKTCPAILEAKVISRWMEKPLSTSYPDRAKSRLRLSSLWNVALSYYSHFRGQVSQSVSWNDIFQSQYLEYSLRIQPGISVTLDTNIRRRTRNVKLLIMPQYDCAISCYFSILKRKHSDMSWPPFHSTVFYSETMNDRERNVNYLVRFVFTKWTPNDVVVLLSVRKFNL
jgi:hypothetical protein